MNLFLNGEQSKGKWVCGDNEESLVLCWSQRKAGVQLVLPGGWGERESHRQQGTETVHQPADETVFAFMANHLF